MGQCFWLRLYHTTYLNFDIAALGCCRLRIFNIPTRFIIFFYSDTCVVVVYLDERSVLR